MYSTRNILNSNSHVDNHFYSLNIFYFNHTHFVKKFRKNGNDKLKSMVDMRDKIQMASDNGRN